MNKIRLIVTGLIVALFGALLVAAPAQQAAPAPEQTYKLRINVEQDGSLSYEHGGIKYASAETALSVTPIDTHRFYFGSNNPERMLCIKDYTPEVTSWDVNRIAAEWAKSNRFHMYWDDMNGGGANCITYDNLQSINMYSYDGGSAGACAFADLDLNSSGFILRATAWLNRTSDNTNCRQTFTLRQNSAAAVVGAILGLAYHVQFADSVMNKYLTYRLQIPYPRPADFAGLEVRYP